MSDNRETHFMRTCSQCGHYEIDKSGDIAESQLKQLQAENKQLQEKLNVVEDAHFNQSDLMMKLNKQLQEKLKLAFEGLEFYADLQSWCMDGIRLDDTEKFDHSIYKIGGKLAREIVAKLKETK